MVHPSAHAGCYEQLQGDKGSVGRRAAQARCRIAVEQHVGRSRSLYLSPLCLAHPRGAPGRKAWCRAWRRWASQKRRPRPHRSCGFLLLHAAMVCDAIRARRCLWHWPRTPLFGMRVGAEGGRPPLLLLPLPLSTPCRARRCLWQRPRILLLGMRMGAAGGPPPSLPLPLSTHTPFRMRVGAKGGPPPNSYCVLHL
jgi:hypothetical protein